MHPTGRGGQFTYHGPGQRVVYVMLDVKRRFGDVRAYVHALETWVIEALGELGVEGRTIDGPQSACGCGGREPAGPGHDKIAAIGVRLRRWVSSHGFALNVDPDLEHFAGIVPCGIRDDGVTSLAALGHPAAWNLWMTPCAGCSSAASGRRGTRCALSSAGMCASECP